MNAASCQRWCSSTGPADSGRPGDRAACVRQFQRESKGACGWRVAKRERAIRVDGLGEEVTQRAVNVEGCYSNNVAANRTQLIGCRYGGRTCKRRGRK